MKINPKGIIAALCGLFLTVSAAWAAPIDAPAPGNVTATLKDASTGEPVGFATVSLTIPGKSSAYKYILSDEDGGVLFEKVRNGTYEFKAEMMGYKTFSKTITVKDGDLSIGEVKLDLDQEMLAAAEVSAVGNPITIKKDTIEYNASSFKTTDNDMLVDLLKKLPGVEVSDDGAVTVNGKSISKVTVGGKTFFLNDPQMATNNIPANVIEKVKVLQKKSEQAEFSGIDDGNEETVLDLQLKQGAKTGGFIGNISGGVGHDLQDWENPSDGDWRYQGNVFTGKFGEKSMLALIANGNNTNQRGFGDFSGDMMRGMGGGVGGGTNSGITNSWMIGLNGSFTLNDGDTELGGNYANNGTKNDVETQSHQITYLDDGSNYIYDKNGLNSTNSYGNRFGIELDHKFSDNTSLLFRPQFNWGKGDFSNVSEFTTLTENGSQRDTSNTGFTASNGNNDNWTASGMMLFRQRLGIPGRTLSLMVDYSLSDNETDGFNQSLTKDYLDDGTVQDSTVNQRYNQHTKNASVTGRLTYTEPLGNSFYISANYEFGWNRSTSAKDTYDGILGSVFDIDSHVYNPTGETYNTTYSNDILNRYINQRIGVDLMYQTDKIRAQVGIGANPTNTHNETTRGGKTATYDSKVVNWAPTAMLFYDISDYQNMRLFYRGSSSQPSTTQLMPVPDNSNPMSVSFGNPTLKPYFSHSMRYEYRVTNPDTYSTLSLNFNGSLTTNPIVNAMWYGSNGAQYSMPVNGPTSLSASLRGFFNSPIARSNFSVSNNFSGSFSKGDSYVGSSFDMSDYYQDGEFDYDAFLGDHPDLDDDPLFTPNKIQSMNVTEQLRLTYRNDFVELQVGGRTRVAKSWYTVSNASTDMTWNNRLTFGMDWTIAQTWGLESDLNYNWYRGYSVDQDDEVIMNAAISKTLNRVTLRLAVNDLFNQSKSLSVTDASNYHLESYSNTLGRYVMLTVSLRFGSFGRRGGMGGGRGPGGFGGGRPPMM